ncbi:glycosyltransferase family 4 protein [Starkeya koreensis]|uniref:Glycosyltransferase family 4 protein n=1 Tax=Ancylobacter koreensis TaxID=266121 RepID=A0ABT0DHH9_9HYPH|nr:glycosyltransferase family 4 protein [Ancylobacter koreensis]MCK0206731.1 glycosyltransferase family 4 protein [Ancylobacter koreensis]
MRRRLARLLCRRANCPPGQVVPCWLYRPRRPAGLDVVGYLRSEIGLGEAARLIVGALDAVAMPTSLIDIPLPGRDSEHALDARIGAPERHAAALSISGLSEMPSFAARLCRAQANILYPFWELPTFPPEWLPAFSRFDALWAPSRFVRDALAAGQPRPVALVPQPVALPDEPPPPAAFKGPLRILTFFDYESAMVRKNPQAAIAAFRLAFPAGTEDVRLIVKTRGASEPQPRAELAALAARDPRVEIIDGTIARAAMDALLHSCDVFLSLHRSEGFGLGAAEALARGKAVVTTDFGGTCDFITPQTGYPVQFRTIPVPPEAYFSTQGSHWADPFPEHAAQTLRAIHDDPAAAAAKARAGYALLRENHSFAAVGARIDALLKTLG